MHQGHASDNHASKDSEEVLSDIWPSLLLWRRSNHKHCDADITRVRPHHTIPKSRRSFHQEVFGESRSGRFTLRAVQETTFVVDEHLTAGVSHAHEDALQPSLLHACRDLCRLCHPWSTVRANTGRPSCTACPLRLSQVVRPPSCVRSVTASTHSGARCKGSCKTVLRAS